MKDSIITTNFDPEGKKLFFDSNIWIYIYGNYQPRNTFVAEYSSFYKRVLNCGASVFTSGVVISETYNRLLRIEFDILKASKEIDCSYKEFRNNLNFNDIFSSINDTCLNIIDECTYIDADLTCEEIKSVILTCGDGVMDFNDAVISKICLSNDAALVTHDGDFSDADITVVTFNKKLLS